MMRPAIAMLSLLTMLGVGGRVVRPRALAAQNQPDRGALAIVRRDGLLRPFAAFKGSRWSSPWPAATRNVDLPVDLSAVPERWWGGVPPTQWDLHPLAGGAIQTVTMVAPRMYRTFCSLGLGIVTSYRPSEPLAPAADPLPKAGLAVSPAIEVLPIDRVDPASPDAPALIKTLIDELNQAEDRTVASTRDYARWAHPVKASVRRTRPISLEAWYRAPLDGPGWSVSYLEAVRAYEPRPEDQGCGLETVFTGWVYQKPTNRRR